MVGAALLVQQQIPVVKRRHAVVEVPDELMGQPQGAFHPVLAAELAEFNTAFGDNQLLVRELPPGQIQRLEMVSAVPVEGRSGHQRGGLLVDNVRSHS